MSVTIDSLDIQIRSSAKSATAEIERLANALNKLKGNSKVSAVTKELDKLTQSSKKAADAQEEHNESIDGAKKGVAGWLASLSSLQERLSNAVQWVKNLTKEAIEWDGIQFRFGQAFGEDAEEVYKWTLKINEALGISVQEFMQYSGIYASLLKGFGVEQSKLTEISVGLTELTYDIWAFSNDRYKRLEDAAEAVRSAITGEIEPIRNAGIALTEASMQEYLDSIGQARVSIEKLTEAQKAEVRYAVMVQSAMQQGIVGTYAREMDTAEGAVRRLSQQVKTLYQSIGSLFIPILQVAIPWITAFVDILADAVYWVAELFNISIGKIDWSKTTSGVDGLADGAETASTALGDAQDAAKKLKNYTMGFDELNVISPSSGSGSGGAGGAEGNGFQGLDLKSVWNDALLESASKKVDEVKAKILEWKVPILVALGLLGTAGIVGTLGTIISKIVTATNVMRAFTGAIAGSKAATSALAFLSPKWSNVAAAFTAIGGAISGAVTAIAAALGISVGWVVAIAAAIVAAIVAIVVYWDEIKLFFTKTLPEWISSAWGVITQFFETAWAAVSGFFSGLWEDVKNIWSVVADWFNDNVIQPLINFFAPIVDWIGEFFRGCWMIVRAVWVVVSEWFSVNVVKPLVNKFGEFKKSVGGFFSSLWTGVKNVWQSVSSWFNTTVVTPVVGWFRGAWTSISGFFSSLWTDVKAVWAGVSGWFYLNVITPVVNFFSAAWKNISIAFESAFNGIATFATNIFNGIIGAVEGIINGVIDGINWLLGGFNTVVSWAASVLKEDWGGLTLIQRVELPRLADGGFVGAGQMFIAREAGPELVGNINGRTAVANNDQIVAAVSQGVYSAVVAAMSASNGSGGQSVNVYLDGRQITAAVEKRQSERGRSIMGNQLGYAY